MANEQHGFVFAVVFMVIFSALLAAWPAGLQGPEETVELITPIDPSLLTDFTDYENYTSAVFVSDAYSYDDFGGRDWTIREYEDAFYLGAKVYIFSFLWLGGYDQVKFTSSTGNDRGTDLSFAEIEADAENGAIRYSLIYPDGNPAGGFVIYWNSTLYPDPQDAWDNDVLYLLHGVGLDSTSTGANILSLLFSLLFLQLPDVPPLLGLLLATPVWASIIYIIWFIIVNMVPFLGGG